MPENIVLANVGLSYNKLVFQNLSNNDQYDSDCKNLLYSIGRKILDTKLSSQLKYSGEGQSFILRTTGPGLLIGTGYSHGSKKSDNEFKLGFSFDHSTGLPILPGHGVKGKLNSCFPRAYKGQKKNLVMSQIKADIKESLDKSFNDTDIETLEKTIFEGMRPNAKEIPMYERDKFLWAYPEKSHHESFNVSIPTEIQKRNNRGELRNVIKAGYDNYAAGTFLFDDNLAPHDHPLKEPVPLRFLKIIANVDIRFQFDLKDGGGLDAPEKQKLFSFLLQKYGVGAKVSEGYGYFIDPEITMESNSELIFPALEGFNPIQLSNPNIHGGNQQRGDRRGGNKKRNTQRAERNNIQIEEREVPLLKEDDSWKTLEEVKASKRVEVYVVEVQNTRYRIQLLIKGMKKALWKEGVKELRERFEKDIKL